MAGWLNRAGTRVGFSQGNLSVNDNFLHPVTTVDVTSGAAGGQGGFVVLMGDLSVSTTDVTDCPCRAGLVLVDDNGLGTNTGVIDTTIADEADEDGAARARVSYTWVRPIPPDTTRTYTLGVSNLDTTVSQVNASGALTVLYVPFAGDGGNTLD